MTERPTTAATDDPQLLSKLRQQRAERPQAMPLPEKARAAFEAIGIHIHERTDDAPLLARWKRAVA